MAKHTPKGSAVKRDPLMLREEPLAFDGMTTEETIELTTAQKQERFLSRWMETVHPFSAYPRVFREGNMEAARLFREIKNYYKSFVVEGDWSEKKYVLTINAIFEQRAAFGPGSVDRFGKLHDENRLPSQIRMKAAGRR